MKNPMLKSGEIGFFALGGLGEVGKNMYVFDIENQLFIVDAGILFPDEHLLGIDYVIPDVSYLIEHQERIVGLFITHGHEDHIGSVPYLLKQVTIPKIYASGIAVDFIEHKLNEHQTPNIPPIEEYKSYYTYNFKNTEVSFIRLTHSIPDMFGIVFKTPQGIIFHTGDFKVDFTPVGPPAEFHKLTEIGQEGVLLLCSDSTNAERVEPIQSESVIGESINELFAKIEGRIIIATFASNLYRIQQIIEASLRNNRKIAVFGRSMERAIEIGIQSGYIKVPKQSIIKGDQVGRYQARELTILVTGSQGEPLAALSRIASNNHRFIKAMPGDTVVFSSSPIPGNQEGVNRTINKLYRLDVDVITHGPIADTHTSGHGNQSDLKMMLSLLKPKLFIPVHGEHRMQRHHRDLAIQCGVKKENVLILDNGDVAAITNQSMRLAGTIPSGEVYIDGTGIGDIGSQVIKERKLLSEEGLFSVIISYDKEKQKLLSSPTIISRGFIYMKGNEAITSNLSNEVEKLMKTELNKKMINELSIKNRIIDHLNQMIYELTLRRPLIIPILVDISS
jgi:ribonuclease J